MTGMPASSRREPLHPLLRRVRSLCLSLPEVQETAAWDHPNFRAGKRTFVTFEHFGGVASIAFCLDPLEVAALERQAGFMRTPYSQGRWVSLTLNPPPKWAVVEALVLKSYQRVALKRMLAQLTRPGSRTPRARRALRGQI